MKLTELLSAEQMKQIEALDAMAKDYIELFDWSESECREVVALWADGSEDFSVFLNELAVELVEFRQKEEEAEAKALNEKLASITFDSRHTFGCLEWFNSADGCLKATECLIKLLEAEGHDPLSYKDTFGKTMLYNLAKAGPHAHDALLMLIARGADVNAITDDGKTPLMKAARWAGLPTVELLLNSGAHVNHQDGEGMTALIKAVCGGSSDTVNELLSRGARVDLVGSHRFFINNTFVTISGDAVAFACQLLPLYCKESPKNTADITARMNACLELLKSAQKNAAEMDEEKAADNAVFVAAAAEDGVLVTSAAQAGVPASRSAAVADRTDVVSHRY